MKKIVIATKNQGKLREMRQAFAHLPVEVVALDAFAEVPEPVEDGATFEENARIKAHAYALATHCACVADDSGRRRIVLAGRLPQARPQSRGAGATATPHLRHPAGKVLHLGVVRGVLDLRRGVLRLALDLVGAALGDELLVPGRLADVLFGHALELV